MSVKFSLCNLPSLLNYSPASKHSGYFSSLTVPNKAMINIPAYKSLFLSPYSQTDSQKWKNWLKSRKDWSNLKHLPAVYKNIIFQSLQLAKKWPILKINFNFCILKDSEDFLISVPPSIFFLRIYKCLLPILLIVIIWGSTILF